MSSEVRLCGNCWRYHCGDFVPVPETNLKFPPPPAKLSVFPNPMEKKELLISFEEDRRTEEVTSLLNKLNVPVTRRTASFETRPFSNTINTSLTELPRLTFDSPSVTLEREGRLPGVETNYLKSIQAYPSHFAMPQLQTTYEGSIITTSPYTSFVVPFGREHELTKDKYTLRTRFQTPSNFANPALHRFQPPQDFPQTFLQPPQISLLASGQMKGAYPFYESQTKAFRRVSIEQKPTPPIPVPDQQQPSQNQAIPNDGFTQKKHSTTSQQDISHNHRQQPSSQKSSILAQQQKSQSSLHSSILERRGRPGRIKVHSCSYKDNRCLGMNLWIDKGSEASLGLDDRGHQRDNLYK